MQLNHNGWIRCSLLDCLSPHTPFARTPAHKQQPSHKLLLLHLCPPVSSPCLSVKSLYKMTVQYRKHARQGPHSNYDSASMAPLHKLLHKVCCCCVCTWLASCKAISVCFSSCLQYCLKLSEPHRFANSLYGSAIGTACLQACTNKTQYSPYS